MFLYSLSVQPLGYTRDRVILIYFREENTYMIIIIGAVGGLAFGLVAVMTLNRRKRNSK